MMPNKASHKVVNVLVVLTSPGRVVKLATLVICLRAGKPVLVVIQAMRAVQAVVAPLFISPMRLMMSYKPHEANDVRWEAVQVLWSCYGVLELKHFRMQLGSGAIGTVYLAELTGTDKAMLEGRKNLLRAQTKREILQWLDHPFLSTLYSHFGTDKAAFLVMEFCPSGDLHVLSQRQWGKYLSGQAARFYMAEILLALEYLHMLGIAYRDLKPENVLLPEDGHIMLSDFDLSLRCASSPIITRSSNLTLDSKTPRPHPTALKLFVRPSLIAPSSACL